MKAPKLVDTNIEELSGVDKPAHGIAGWAVMKGADPLLADRPTSTSTDKAERKFPGDARDRYASQGVALPDGSFPIPDVDALRRAIQALGRAKDPAAAKRHIISRARALNATDQLPDDWKVSKGGTMTDSAVDFEKELDTILKEAEQLDQAASTLTKAMEDGRDLLFSDAPPSIRKSVNDIYAFIKEQQGVGESSAAELIAGANKSIIKRMAEVLNRAVGKPTVDDDEVEPDADDPPGPKGGDKTGDKKPFPGAKPFKAKKEATVNKQQAVDLVAALTKAIAAGDDESIAKAVESVIGVEKSAEELAAEKAAADKAAAAAKAADADEKEPDADDKTKKSEDVPAWAQTLAKSMDDIVGAVDGIADRLVKVESGMAMRKSIAGQDATSASADKKSAGAETELKKEAGVFDSIITTLAKSPYGTKVTVNG